MRFIYLPQQFPEVVLRTGPGILKSLIGFIICGFILAVNITSSAKTIYVKSSAPPSGSGTSWSDAYDSLQDALDTADPCDQIWVAAGTYIPTARIDPCDPRTATFQMINGVAIYGGFPSSGNPNFSDRNPNTYLSILSGDLLGNDDPCTPVEDLLDDPCRADNAYHVFYHPQELSLDYSALLDGFTITAGNAVGAYSHYSGGGIYNFLCSPTITNCTFSANSALHGAGFYNCFNSNPAVTDCTFFANSASCGGGIYNIGSPDTPYLFNSAPTITGCAFISNIASQGGGVCNYHSDPTFNDCTFTANSAGWGGGMVNETSAPTVRNCTFTTNSADIGGGICNRPWVHCYYTYLNSPRNAFYFTDNSADYDSELYYLRPTFTNCSFNSNSANDGGGMYNYQISATLESCSFTANSANGYGGGVYNSAYNSRFVNCILWDNIAFNSGNEIYNTSTLVIRFCDIADCGGSGSGWDNTLGSDGGGNIDADPCFIDADGPDDIPGTNDDDLSLNSGSLCIDSGDNYAVHIAYDLDGQPRIMDGDNDGTAIVDMGSYEHNGPAYEPVVVYVNAAASGANNGSSWTDSFLSLQDALDAVIFGDQIWVAAGTYTPTVRIDPCDPRTATFQMKNGIAIYGGFPNSGDPNFSDRDPNTYFSILSGDLLGNDNPDAHVSFLFRDPCRADNSYHVFYHPEGLNLNSSALLDGFIITAGNANSDDYDESPHYYGGGMYNAVSSPEVTNCTFSANSADVGGGAMYNEGSNPTVTNCTISGNSADYKGGGIYNRVWESYTSCFSSNPTVTSCTFTDNRAYFSGGGMYNIGSNPNITNCTFTHNWADIYGGGMSNLAWAPYGFVIACNPKVTNCTFIANENDFGGSGMYNSASSPTITACSFCGQLFVEYSYAMVNESGSNPIVTKCTFSNNAIGMSNYSHSSPTVTDCNFIDNTSYMVGIGMANNEYSSPTVTNCTFTANYYSGMYNYDHSNPVVSNCIFNQNSCGGMYNGFYCCPTVNNCIFTANLNEYFNGGGMYNILYSSPFVNNCIFTCNSADYGGGMSNFDDSNPIVTNCRFVDNTAHEGGGIYTSRGNPTIANCTFIANTGYYGGGMYLYDESSSTIDNCTFAYNSAQIGSGLLNATSNPTLTNCIFWADYTPFRFEIDNFGGNVLISFCNIADCGSSGAGWNYLLGTDGGGNIDVDPCFVDPGRWDDPCNTPSDPTDDLWIAGDYHLKSSGWRWDTIRQRWDYDNVTSRCIDAGNPGSPLSNEPLTIPDDPGNSWGVNIRINMGAYGGTSQAGMPPYDWTLLADLTNDGTVNLMDFAGQTTYWLQSANAQPPDLNRDGTVDIIDLSLLLSDWLNTTSWFH